MNKKEARARIEAAEKELAAAKAALKEAEKTLMWHELPSGAYFKCKDGWFIFRAMHKAMGDKNVEYAIAVSPTIESGVWTKDRPYSGFLQPVTRVHPDGTPYEGDPRK